MAHARYAFIVAIVLSFVARGAEPTSQPSSHKSVYGTVLHDDKRDKDLRLTIHVPKSPGPHPLIVFSHGAGGSGEYYNGLTTGWADNGYVIIAPTHADSILLMSRDERRDLKARDVVVDAVTDVKGWQERPRDVSFILDSLDELERTVAELPAGTIDRSRIGVAGHSYGGMTTTMLAGGAIRTKVGGELKSFADPRVKAAIVLSGQGEGQMGFGEDSWDGLKIPLMVMTGSEDRGAKGQDPRWRKAPYANSPAGDKYWVFIEGATHSSFVGRPVGFAQRGVLRDLSKNHKDVFAVIQRATASFWDAYLKGDAPAKEFLQSEKLSKEAAVSVEYEKR
jgi:predicted dienelactone hydrolase